MKYLFIILISLILLFACNDSTKPTNNPQPQFGTDGEIINDFLEYLTDDYLLNQMNYDEMPIYFHDDLKYLEENVFSTDDTLISSALGYSSLTGNEFDDQREAYIEIINNPDKKKELLDYLKNNFQAEELQDDETVPYASFVMPYFSGDNKSAVVGYGDYCGNLCAHWYLSLFIFENGKWQHKETLSFSIS